MNQTWLNFPLRLLIAILLLALVLFWQFSFDLGGYYYMEGHTEQYVNLNYELALMNYRLSLRYQPDNPVHYYQIGLVLINTGQLEDAVNHLETALSLDYEPRWRVLAPLSRILRNLGRDDEAAVYQAELDSSRQR